MDWNFTPDRPIYQQIVQQIQMGLLSGEYKAGEKLAGVRELAAQAKVNPNTMQRAMQELEQQGFVVTQRTAGRTFTEDSQMIDILRQQAAKVQLEEFLQRMNQLGFNKKDIITLIEKEAN